MTVENSITKIKLSSEEFLTLRNAEAILYNLGYYYKTVSVNVDGGVLIESNESQEYSDAAHTIGSLLTSDLLEIIKETN